jgi:hypothetical protein
MTMSIRRSLALALTLGLAAGTLPTVLSAAPQQTGVIAGKATDEAKKPYSNYTVRLRDVVAGQIATTVPLDPQGRFSFNAVTLATRYLVELFSTKDNKVVCTEGPYTLTASALNKTDVNINCGTNPAAWWLAAAGGAAALIAVAVRSASR